MQRSKAAVSVEVKRVIAALCRLLAATGLESVPAPETFRRAKFDGGPEVERQFWQLLAIILQKSSSVSSEGYAGGATENRKLVAAGLWQTGYHADWMYGSGGGEGGGGGGGGEGGEGGEGGRVSSRDLLLALGWLLAAGKLEVLLTQRVLELDKTLLTPPPVNPPLTTDLQLDAASLRKLQWLIGRLRHQGRSLLAVQDERARMLHAVFFASLPCTISSDQSSAALKETCACLQQLCELLEAYLNWRQVEKIFWTWMDSVLDCHRRNPVVDTPTHDAPSGSVRVCHHGVWGLEMLEDMLLRLPTGQKKQRGGRGHVENRGGSGVSSHGGSDAARLPPPPLPASSCLPPRTQVYRARLQTESPIRHSSHPAEGARGGAETVDELPASEAVRLLLQTEAVLLKRRDRQRLANRTQLQEAISRLDQLVLIPP